MKIDESHKECFNEYDFWEKIQGLVSRACIKLIETALTLYYIAKHPSTPIPVKVMIFAVLGYLILPIDIIPDVLPLGLTDDFAALVTVLKTNQKYVTPQISRMVSNIIERLRNDFT